MADSMLRICLSSQCKNEVPERSSDYSKSYTMADTLGPFCSHECFKDYDAEQQKGMPMPREKISCRFCHEKFTPVDDYHIYCDHECEEKANAEMDECGRTKDELIDELRGMLKSVNDDLKQWTTAIDDLLGEETKKGFIAWERSSINPAVLTDEDVIDLSDFDISEEHQAEYKDLIWKEGGATFKELHQLLNKHGY